MGPRRGDAVVEAGVAELGDPGEVAEAPAFDEGGGRRHHVRVRERERKARGRRGRRGAPARRGRGSRRPKPAGRGGAAARRIQLAAPASAAAAGRGGFGRGGARPRGGVCGPPSSSAAVSAAASSAAVGPDVVGPDDAKAARRGGTVSGRDEARDVRAARSCRPGASSWAGPRPGPSPGLNASRAGATAWRWAKDVGASGTPPGAPSADELEDSEARKGRGAAVEGEAEAALRASKPTASLFRWSSLRVLQLSRISSTRLPRNCALFALRSRAAADRGPTPQRRQVLEGGAKSRVRTRPAGQERSRAREEPPSDAHPPRGLLPPRPAAEGGRPAEHAAGVAVRGRRRPAAVDGEAPPATHGGSL